MNHPKVAIEFHVNGAMAAGIDHTGAVIIEDMEAGAGKLLQKYLRLCFESRLRLS